MECSGIAGCQEGGGALEDFCGGNLQKAVEYKDVSQQILRSKPPQPQTVPFIFRFVLQYGGGFGGSSFLLKSEAHIRAFGHAQRMLGLEFWDAISTEVKAGEVERPPCKL